jgi:hypothetical protein
MTWSHWLELIFAKQLRTVPRVTRVVVGDTRLVYYEPQDQTPASGAKAEWVQTSLFQGGFEGIGLDEAVRGATRMTVNLFSTSLSVVLEIR